MDLALSLLPVAVIANRDGWPQTIAELVGSGLVLNVLLCASIVAIVIPTVTSGQSPGKWLFGLTVVNVDGHAPSTGHHILRTLGSVIDLSPLVIPGLVGFAVAAGSPRHQRIGDRLAKTMVIKQTSAAEQPQPDHGHEHDSSPLPPQPAPGHAQPAPGHAQPERPVTQESDWGSGTAQEFAVNEVAAPQSHSPTLRGSRLVTAATSMPSEHQPKPSTYPRPRHRQLPDEEVTTETDTPADEPVWNAEWGTWVCWSDEANAWLRYDHERQHWLAMDLQPTRV